MKPVVKRRLSAKTGRRQNSVKPYAEIATVRTPVNTPPEGQAVRDSKQPPSAPVHFFTPQAWTPFIQALRPPSTPLARPREML
ncbi:DUF397 domain-containing protein [Streptomyces acidiscabies]|uniref:DUF397 domain-containing protein n=1 Tax=Streptomyces acidiscabies TaxID=42234 RepID=UPI00096297D0|nr:DUF397 domain-containing protein [Streptomyces acidiscabies]GAV41503.1 hypothetical protein Saa2_04408 [Streptomyces acidiscabies]